MCPTTSSAPDLRYLTLLAKQYPNIESASSEIINLTASLHLPKGTEHFISDIHGEYEAFSHVLRSGSGSIKRKIDELFGNELTEEERNDLAALIYYPKQKMALTLKELDESSRWLRSTLLQLIHLGRMVASKYTRSSVRAALPSDFAFILEELLNEQESVENKLDYYNSILDTVISIGSAEKLIVSLSELIQRLQIAHLHILGDIYDRSPGGHLIVDDLINYHSVDIQWGNHDILWMGAAAGSEACIANVIRISLRYGNLETLENGYAISMFPLASFAMDFYADDPCEQFQPKDLSESWDTKEEIELVKKMHKAITIIQLKLEGQLIKRNPQFRMQNRLLLENIDYEDGNIQLDGKNYPLQDKNFPTIDPNNIYELSEREQSVMERLVLSFKNSESLQRHVRFLLSKGSMYHIYNGNLLYHGCIPMDLDGEFLEFEEHGIAYRGKAYMDHLDRLVRQGFLARDPVSRQYGLDILWYLWAGESSPLFGKHKMATFESYFISDKSAHVELKNAYYKFRDLEKTADKIMREFGIDPEIGHIINGHVPVEVKKGESPIKAAGKLLVIDGGFAKAYQRKTGIAGYTLIFNSYGLLLASHHPFESVEKYLETHGGSLSYSDVLENNTIRIRVRDTDRGKEILSQIDDLQVLLSAYQSGIIQES